MAQYCKHMLVPGPWDAMVGPSRGKCSSLVVTCTLFTRRTHAMHGTPGQRVPSSLPLELPLYQPLPRTPHFQGTNVVPTYLLRSGLK